MTLNFGALNPITRSGEQRLALPEPESVGPDLGSPMLTPTEEDQELPISIATVERLADGAHPRFALRARGFLAQLQPGDEVVEFCTARRTWQALCGRAGCRIIRKGTVWRT